MRNVHKLTEGAVLLAAFAVLILITIYVPVLGIATNLFLAVPFILFAAKNTRMNAFVFLIAAILLSLIVGTILAVPLTLSYGMTGLVIGYFIQEKKGRGATFIAGSLVFLANLLLQYAVAVAFFKINFIEEVIDLMKESINRSKSMLDAIGQNTDGAVVEQFESFLETIELLTPSLFVMMSLMAVILIELVSFPIIKRFGINPGPRKPFRELTMPKSILWYYLITILASFVIKPAEGSYWFLALINIAFSLQLIMVFQGLSFIFYISYKKGLPRAIPIVVTVFTLLIPVFLSIVRILGIIDLGFGLRKRLEKTDE
ncbi:YybS family protein [Bacillus sp. FJAT-29790]|uniref:YybS family protein n=1 Tax=Bacillus sp. FJAT-29790 TaxID=1895002 RepID=UPI001C237723|nr:YybS family protein [Bacillus sp. FJAT-29790]MBU8881266.1 YybS family protein [Bacillus sp. FJAT-29790]